MRVRAGAPRPARGRTRARGPGPAGDLGPAEHPTSTSDAPVVCHDVRSKTQVKASVFIVCREKRDSDSERERASARKIAACSRESCSQLEENRATFLTGMIGTTELPNLSQRDKVS